MHLHLGRGGTRGGRTGDTGGTGINHHNSQQHYDEQRHRKAATLISPAHVQNDNPPMTQIYHAPEGKFHYEHGFPSGYHLIAKETERSSVYRVERLNGR